MPRPLINAYVSTIQDASSATQAAISAIRDRLDVVNRIAVEVAETAQHQGRSSEAIVDALAAAADQANVVSSSITEVNECAATNGTRAQDLKAQSVAALPRSWRD